MNSHQTNPDGQTVTVSPSVITKPFVASLIPDFTDASAPDVVGHRVNNRCALSHVETCRS